MSEPLQKEDRQEQPVPLTESSWVAARPPKEGCPTLYISGNELLTIPSALEAVATKTLSLLTIDIKTRKSVGVSRETIERLNIAVCVIVTRSTAIWDFLLATEETDKKLDGSIVTTKSVRLQTEYMSTGKIKVTLHTPMDILFDHLGTFFSKYGPVGDVSSVISKLSIIT